MRIKLNEIDNEILREFSFIVSDVESIELDGELSVKGSIRKEGNEYILEGKYSANVKTQCVRCLEDLVVNLDNKDFYGVFLAEDDYRKYDDSLEKNGVMSDDDYFEAVENTVDVLEFVREQIILDMPQYPSCVPNCKDDSYIKKYGEEQSDFRWAGLLDIEIKN